MMFLAMLMLVVRFISGFRLRLGFMLRMMINFVGFRVFFVV